MYTAACRIPLMENDSVILMCYANDPALEGTILIFSCPPGMQLIGSNITIATVTCMENGEWEPDPRELKLKCQV